MSDFIEVSNSILQCPKCGTEFKIKGNVLPTRHKKGTSGCLAHGTCPHCNHEACANRETLECTPSTLG